MEAQQAARLHALEHRVRLVHADSYRTYRGAALHPAPGQAAILPDILQVLRGGGRAYYGGCGAVLPHGLLPSGGAQRHSARDNKEDTLTPVRHEEDDQAEPARHDRPLLAVGHIPPEAPRRGLHGRHQRWLLPHQVTQPSVHCLPQRSRQHPALVVGLFLRPRNLLRSAALHALHAHPLRDTPDPDAQRRSQDTQRAQGPRQSPGIFLPWLRTLHRRLPDERAEGQHQRHNRLPEQADTPRQREAHRGDKRQVPALRQMYRRLSRGCRGRQAAHSPEVRAPLRHQPRLFLHRHRSADCGQPREGALLRTEAYAAEGPCGWPDASRRPCR